MAFVNTSSLNDRELGMGVRALVSEWVSEWMSEWVTEQVSEWAS